MRLWTCSLTCTDIGQAFCLGQQSDGPYWTLSWHISFADFNLHRSVFPQLQTLKSLKWFERRALIHPTLFWRQRSAHFHSERKTILLTWGFACGLWRTGHVGPLLVRKKTVNERDVNVCDEQPFCLWSRHQAPSNLCLSQPPAPFHPSHLSDLHSPHTDLWHMPHTDDLTPSISHSLPRPQARLGTRSFAVNQNTPRRHTSLQRISTQLRDATNAARRHALLILTCAHTLNS